MHRESGQSVSFRALTSRLRAAQRVGAGLAAVVLLLGASPVLIAAPGEVNHTVIFWLKDPQNAADRAAIVEASKSLGTLPGVVRVEVGHAMPVQRPNVEQVFDLCAVFTFRDRAALQEYQADPRHKQVINDVLKPRVKHYIVFDSVLE
jgi:hypothetical protein